MLLRNSSYWTEAMHINSNIVFNDLLKFILLLGHKMEYSNGSIIDGKIQNIKIDFHIEGYSNVNHEHDHDINIKILSSFNNFNPLKCS